VQSKHFDNNHSFLGLGTGHLKKPGTPQAAKKTEDNIYQTINVSVLEFELPGIKL